MWDGRFQKETDKAANDYNTSLPFDCRMYEQDIRGSMAHCRMLKTQGILTPEDASKILSGLSGILTDINDGKLTFDSEAEDIHMFVEEELTLRIGEAGKRLHTGRSRNDQVALDIRLYLMDEMKQIRKLIMKLYRTLIIKAGENTTTIMPGYTHMQRAQPITLGHHLCAYIQMLQRDMTRLDDAVVRMNYSPLGSGALAGTTYPLDREAAAADLGFAGVTQNSLDGVSDRDFVIEIAGVLSILMMHLSRFSEEIILWSTQEFAFIDLDDAYATGSSIMPQKKNPDIAELTRGKTGRVYGDLMALLVVMKGLPLAYNKDMQEDKEAVFDAIDTVKGALIPFTGMVATMNIRKDRMEQAAAGGFTNATDLADYLVKKGLPFRSAHEVSGKLVKYCLDAGIALLDVGIDEFRSFSVLIEDDVYEAISLLTCVNSRTITGAPSPETVRKALDAAEQFL
ncbi:MAG: argininosuccinate lyase [Eubacteriales bacterium]